MRVAPYHPAPHHPDEVRRLSVLDRLGLLDDDADDRLASLVEVTARALDFPVAFVSLVGAEHQVLRASYGTDLTVTDRASSLCGWAVATSGPLAVPDLGEDSRFAGNPLVASTGWRSYVGVPLVASGMPVGTLCVADVQPRPVDDGDVDVLVRLADVALAALQARQPAPSGRAGRTAARQARAAVAAGAVETLYQPVVRLVDSVVHGVEALVRWPGDAPREADTGQFRSLAEQSELVLAVDRAVLAQACAKVGALRTQLPAAVDLRLSVNLSARHLDRGDVVDSVTAALDGCGLAPDALTVELSQAALMRTGERGTAALHALRAAGVGIALDDFGGGHSSLSDLRRLPITELKLAAELVRGLGAGGPEEALVEAVVRLADRLGMTVVADGVDTVQQAEALRVLGCRYGQGALFFPPREADALDEMLLQRSADASLESWAELLRRRRAGG